MTSAASISTVLFVDVAGSTGMYEQLGNATAHARIHDALSGVRAIVVQSRGVVIKEIGDELMCCFPSAADAVAAACDIQDRFRVAAGPPPRVSFRIGLHSGEAIWNDADLFGDAVNVAARLVAMAKAEQILTSKDTLSQCGSSPRGGTREIGAVTVKGRRQPVDCVEVIWKDEKELTTWTGAGAVSAAPASLSLVFGGVSLLVGDARPRVTMGRDRGNDLCVASPRVSSSHAAIERRGDKFFLRDQSTNGCLVVPSDRPGYKVHREEVALWGEGVIVLGGEPEEPDRSIRFKSVL
jgi:adenylate cyclase